MLASGGRDGSSEQASWLTVRLAISESQSGLVKEPCLEAKVAGYSKRNPTSIHMCVCVRAQIQIHNTHTQIQIHSHLRMGGGLLFVTISYMGYQGPNSSSSQVLSLVKREGCLSIFQFQEIKLSHRAIPGRRIHSVEFLVRLCCNERWWCCSL